MKIKQGGAKEMKEYNDVSPYFHLFEIKDGIYVAVAKKGKGALGNAGFVDLGDSTIVFDTFLTPQAARDLRKAAELYTNHKVSYVVNSHYHFDHVLGNQIFSDVPIISTQETRRLIQKEMDFSDLEQIRTEIQQSLTELQAEIDKQNTTLMIESLSNQMAEVQMLYNTIGDIQPILPTLTFEKSLEISGSKRSVELLCYGRGHTNSDVFLYLPEEKTVFAGDLVLNNTHPWIGHGHPQQWKIILNQISSLKADIIVPGHGIPGTMHNIASMQQYITDIEAIVNEALTTDQNTEELKQLEIPDLYKEWAGSHIFYNNIISLLSSKKEEISKKEEKMI